ncbi:extracellular solute-binding protein [Nocardioides mesophilus]|uniref:Extracellular solute-binding protein n=1 Tax=Nocardioides mesophilus TaxID=433659 RepID=A0A7G9R7U2_9ACTN|nr:extracellular solute-binding protein [Nocardioides mesophilus]QNN51667.1 extracellular solute-binding protein [Nocardioides mesophilus]
MATRSQRKQLAVAAILALMAALLAACGGSSSAKPTLNWYINPDTGGQDAVAKKCSTDQYTIATQVLPTDATQQRIQLARRLAASDSSIDLMSIDPPYTAEFANAGYLAPIADRFAAKLKSQSFKSAIAAATWKGKLVVAPFWSNTQVLWYRKSFVDKAGIDMSKPVTWDQLIKVASQNGGTVAVQANRYEGYVVWINALVSGAGGSLVQDAAKGVDAKITINSPAGEDAAKVIEELAGSSAKPADLSVSTEGTASTTFGSSKGAFMVNWTFIWHNYDETDPAVAKDIGYAMYPETVAGEQARPPYGGIGIGVSSFSNHIDLATKAMECITSPDNQGINAELTGNMPASAAGYDYPPLKKLYPPDLLALFQKSLQVAAPRSVTPYWGDISSAILSTWHSPTSVNDQTPQESATFIEQVLKGDALL